MKKKIAMTVFLLLFSVVVPFALAQDENVAGATPTETPSPMPSVEVTPTSAGTPTSTPVSTPTESPNATALPNVNTPAPVETPTPSETPGVIPMPTMSPEETPEATPSETGNEAGEGINPDTNQPVVDEQTGKEIVAMQLAPGAKVRLLELEKAVLRNILKGRKVIEFIKEKDSNADVTDLEAVLAELETLKEQIATVQPQANSDETVKQFVDLKNDAISLSKQFRDTARELLKGTDKKGLGAKFKEIDWSELKTLNNQIRQLIREYNAQRVERVFQNLKGKAPAFVEKIRAGKMSVKQVRAEMLKVFKALKPMQRGKVFQNLKQLNAKRRVFRQAKIVAAKLNFLARRAKRLENRIQRIKQNPKFKAIMDKLRNRINKRIQNGKNQWAGNKKQGSSGNRTRKPRPLNGIAGHRGGA